MGTIIMQQKNIGNHARLRENELLLRCRALLVGGFWTLNKELLHSSRWLKTVSSTFQDLEFDGSF